VSDDVAHIVTGAAVEMLTDGPCLVGTLEQLEQGVGAKPMPKGALGRVRTAALSLLSRVLEAYATNVAEDEVGLHGSGLASNAAPRSPKAATGLLYGRVQSGKTVAMITFCAAAIDNGFRVIVVLTSDFQKLVEQTADRFAALDGPIVKSALQQDNWNTDREHVRKQVGKLGVVFVCNKNQQRLKTLVEFLVAIGASDYPALVLDDEADQATLDTTTQARSSGRKNSPTQASAIHRRTVQDEDGQSIRQTLRHHVFVQVTATPYALLLQSVNNDLRPAFTELLEPGDGYTGGEAFFDVQHVEDGAPPLVSVDEDESVIIDAATDGMPPTGLQRALAFFLVGAGAQNIIDPDSRSVGQNFLCHTSQNTSEHTRVADLIRSYVNRVNDELDSGAPNGEIMNRLQWAYQELHRTIASPPDFDTIVARIKKRLPRREVPVVNSNNSSVDFSRQLNFIVGGNILGRGLTIDNLLVTYYIRRAKVSQMDTVLQHARMFGYRSALMPYTRVFLPESLGAKFHFIHKSEQGLRQQLQSNGGAGKVAVEVMSALRPTRLNVLDTRYLAAYEPGDHIYPGAPALKPRDLANNAEIEAAVKKAFCGAVRDSVFVPVEIPALVELLPQLPFDPDLANTWDPKWLAQILERIASRNGNAGYMYFRPMRRTKATFPTGALSGDELREARQQGGPVLCVFRGDGRALTRMFVDRDYWYPSLVLPASMPTQLFNTTS
jgi:hypothetical protein